MLVQCTVTIARQPSSGKYGVTVTRPSPYPETAKEAGSEEALFQLLFCLGYPAFAIHGIISQLKPPNDA